MIGEGSFGSVYEVGMRRGISGVGLKALCVGIPVQFIYMYGERERERYTEIVSFKLSPFNLGLYMG